MSEAEAKALAELLCAVIDYAMQKMHDVNRTTNTLMVINGRERIEKALLNIQHLP